MDFNLKLSKTLSIALAMFTALGTAANAETSKILPPPEQPIKSTIGVTFKSSKPGKIKVREAPKGSPNVVIVLLDDVGFAASSTFGGPIPTPALEKLAKRGLKYNRFHTTALCSPSRAAILTGRDHHNTGTGVITEIATGFDGYTGSIPKSTACIAEVLRLNGFSTAAFGKWHNTPVWETSAAGPFDRWPTGMGFEKFYGFNGGEAHQFDPALFVDTTPIDPPKKPGYHLTEDLAEKAISWMRLQKTIAPKKPFFVYWAPGATHAPHHVPKEWVEKFKGKFDQGWDKIREGILARQKELGVVPESTKLTPRPKQIPAYDSLSPARKEIAAKLMETYAGFLAHTDAQVGKLIDSLEKNGEFDNTLFFYIVGDNGASGEGSPFGVFNEISVLNGVPEDPETVVKRKDEIGSTSAYNHYPVGWAWAMDTPFQWTKQVASHFGGTRNGMVVAWPDKIKKAGGLRSQFHHCTDIVPTILEATTCSAPDIVNGVPQKPLDGVSMMYAFDNKDAKDARVMQYFEMFTNRAMYRDGWIASCFHGKAPWEISAKGSGEIGNEKWELYNINKDFSQAVDLADENPAKLRELRELFIAVAGRKNVFPLDDRGFARVLGAQPASLSAGRNSWTLYQGAFRIPESSAPDLKNRSFTINIDCDIDKDKSNKGVLVAQGGTCAGWSIFVRDQKLHYTYNYLSQEVTKISSKEKLPAGKNNITVKFTYDGGGLGKGGKIELMTNGKLIASGRIEKTVPLIISADDTFDVGKDTGSVVDHSYHSQRPFEYAGNIRTVKIKLAEKK